MASIYIGTSGWSYDHWQGPFYPTDLAKEKWLAYYSGSFETVEINNSFYQLPSEETLRRWYESVPASFTFAFKANRYITHMKKLKDPEEPLKTLYDRASILGKKLGPILFQLPPNWHLDRDRLSHFLDALSHQYRHVFEFRNDRWITPETLSLLRQHDAAFCIYEFAGRQSPKEITADFAYVRLHGPLDVPYRGSYNQAALCGWAGAISSWVRRNGNVFCYFDNDEAGHAAQDALRLQRMFA